MEWPQSTPQCFFPHSRSWELSIINSHNMISELDSPPTPRRMWEEVRSLYVKKKKKQTRTHMYVYIHTYVHTHTHIHTHKMLWRVICLVACYSQIILSFNFLQLGHLLSFVDGYLKLCLYIASHDTVNKKGSVSICQGGKDAFQEASSEEGNEVILAMYERHRCFPEGTIGSPSISSFRLYSLEGFYMS